MITHLLLAFFAVAAAEKPAPDVVVVCPAQFDAALAPWVEHRTAQGRRIALVNPTGSAEDVRSRIRKALGPNTPEAIAKPRFIVLVGDADPRSAKDQAIASRSIPTHHETAKVNVKWGSEPILASDSWYADLNDDGKPDAAIGRLTCDTSDELARIVKKIIAYENSADMGTWRRRVNLVAGVGGFGAIADTMIESAAKAVITSSVPAAYDTTMTYGSWQSPYCPPPHQFRDVTLSRLNEGSLFWVYMGHGQRRWLDTIQTPVSRHPVLSYRDVPLMKSARGSPIALFLACYTGAFDEPDDCIAEEMLRAEGAPIAAVCGSRVTMPYAMAVMSGEMMHECFVKRRETLGEVILHAKRSLASEEGNAPNRKALDAIATLVSPKGTNPADERAEHVLLFNLIGDPLLRLPHPAPITVETAKHTTPGEEVAVAGTCDVQGKCTVQLVLRRDRLAFAPPERKQYDASKAAMAKYAEIYQKANDCVLATATVDVADGKFAARLVVPPGCEGACHVRAFVQGAKQAAAGAADIYVRRKRQADRQAAIVPNAGATP